MKKNNKEIKERLLKAHALSDEELEQVTGGKEEVGAEFKGTYSYACRRYVQLDSSGICTDYSTGCWSLCEYGLGPIQNDDVPDDGKWPR